MRGVVQDMISASMAIGFLPHGQPVGGRSERGMAYRIWHDGTSEKKGADRGGKKGRGKSIPRTIRFPGGPKRDETPSKHNLLF